MIVPEPLLPLVVPTSKLPSKPGELLALALDDLDKLLATESVALDLRSWVMPTNGAALCSVCLAGAVMLRRLKVDGVPERVPDIPMDTQAEHQDALWLLDALASGYPDKLMPRSFDYEVLETPSVCDKLDEIYELTRVAELDQDAWLKRMHELKDILLSHE